MTKIRYDPEICLGCPQAGHNKECLQKYECVFEDLRAQLEMSERAYLLEVLEEWKKPEEFPWSRVAEYPVTGCDACGVGAVPWHPVFWFEGRELQCLHCHEVFTVHVESSSVELSKKGGVMIVVESILKAYEVDGQEPKELDYKLLHVQSHGIMREKVVLQFEDGPKITVVGKDLEAAIKNAMNTAR